MLNQNNISIKMLNAMLRSTGIRRNYTKAKNKVVQISNRLQIFSNHFSETFEEIWVMQFLEKTRDKNSE